MSQAEPIAIIGAGIAGLTAALRLAQKGFAVDILEQAGHLSDAGAGLQLSPNATRILFRLGLEEALAPVWMEPDDIRLVDGRSLRLLAAVPAGRFARNRWQSPYGVLSRSDLQLVLTDAVARQPLCRLHFGHRVGAPSQAALEALTGEKPHLIVGADGIWSETRKTLQRSDPTHFSGTIAWRMRLRAFDAPPIFKPTAVTAFLGRNAHLVVYPQPASEGFNLVAVAAGRSATGSAAVPETRISVRKAFDGWHGDILSALSHAQDLGVWPLYAVSDGPWHTSSASTGLSTVLIGDAAHAMLPFAAQGSAMAIEDAYELGSFLGTGSDISAALMAYVAHRKPRIARVRARSGFNRFAYHAHGPIRLGRNLVLRLRGPERLAADLDWLYGYIPQE